MAKTYYIDGYNVLHKSKRLRPLVQRDLESAREGLIDRVADFCIATGLRAILVFDGLGAQRVETVEHHRGAPTLDVRYAPHHLSADAVIEREVYRERDKLQVVVVSSDRGIRDLVRGMGALTMEPDSFLASLTESTEDISATLRHQRRDQPGFLEDMLGDDSIARLMKLKDKLPDRRKG